MKVYLVEFSEKFEDEYGMFREYVSWIEKVFDSFEKAEKYCLENGKLAEDAIFENTYQMHDKEKIEAIMHDDELEPDHIFDLTIIEKELE